MMNLFVLPAFVVLATVLLIVIGDVRAYFRNKAIDKKIAAREAREAVAKAARAAKIAEENARLEREFAIRQKQEREEEYNRICHNALVWQKIKAIRNRAKNEALFSGEDYHHVISRMMRDYKATVGIDLYSQFQ